MRPRVERDDARFVNQFLEDDHVAGRLEDLIVAAVPAADSVPPARDAARPQAEIGEAVGRTAFGSIGPLGGEPCLRFRRERWNTAIGWIGNQRSTGERLALVAPERIVGPWIAGARRLVEAPPLRLLERLGLLLA